MIVRVIWEFDADVENLDSKYVDLPGLARDLTKLELASLMQSGDITVDDFEYSVVI